MDYNITGIQDSLGLQKVFNQITTIRGFFSPKQPAGESMNKSKIAIDNVLTNIYRLSMHLKRRCLYDLT